MNTIDMVNITGKMDTAAVKDDASDIIKHKVSLSREWSRMLDEEMKRTGYSRSQIIEESIKVYFTMGSQPSDYIGPNARRIMCRVVNHINEGVNLIKRGETEKGIQEIDKEIEKLCQTL